jgi:hypothetical protein
MHVVRGIPQELVHSVPYDSQARQVPTVDRVKVEMARGGRCRHLVVHIEIRLLFLDSCLPNFTLFCEDAFPDLASFEEIFVDTEVGANSRFLAFLAEPDNDASLAVHVKIEEKNAYIRFKSTSLSMR